MPQPFTSYAPAISPRSQLLMNPPEAVPPLEDLVSLENELKTLQAKSVARGKKAEGDLKALDALWRKAKEREKGKAKSVVIKVKRETSGTPAPQTPNQIWLPPRSSVQPSASSVPPTSHGLPKPRKSKEHDANRKKKRKREVDSDGESYEPDSQSQPQKPRVAHLSPPPVRHPEPHTQPVKKDKEKVKDLPPAKTNGAGFRVAVDFTLPPRSYAPTRPPPTAPIPPGPSSPTQVNQDFSATVKVPPNQIQIGTFWNFVEPWIRPLKDEDIAFLEFNGDDVEPFLIPPLGRHYADVWEEEDALAAGESYPRPAPSNSNSVALHNPWSTNAESSSTRNLGARWDPSTLADADLITEEKSLGPFTERLMAAFLEDPKGSTAVPMDTDEPSSSDWGKRDTASVGTLEERIFAELSAVGLVKEDEKLDPTHADDDQITTELRQCQRALRKQMEINTARKARLIGIAKDRLAYSDYCEMRDALERKIQAGFVRLTKVGAPVKKKKKGATVPAPVPGQAQGVLGMGLINPDGDLEVPEDLTNVVQMRKAFVESVGKGIDEWSKREPGRLYGLPKKSIYDGLPTDVPIKKDKGPTVSGL